MKITIVIMHFVFFCSSCVLAGETKILFDKYELPEQNSNDYYIKESVKSVNKKTPYILEVNTYKIVTGQGGTTTYKSTFQVNCKKMQYTTIKSWSSGFGENKTIKDGKWKPVSDYPDTEALYKKICLDR